MRELETLLQEQEACDANLPTAKRPRRFILVEGLFANSGDLAQLPALIRLRDTYGCCLIVEVTGVALETGGSRCGAAADIRQSAA